MERHEYLPVSFCQLAHSCEPIDEEPGDLKALVAATTVAVNNLGTASGQALAEMLDSGKIGENKVFIGAWQADGTVVLRAAIESESVLNAALAKAFLVPHCSCP